SRSMVLSANQGARKLEPEHKEDAEMARRNVEEVEDVVEETPAAEETTETKQRGPKRGELPEGYVTPVGLAKVLSERKLHTNRQGEAVEVKPQMVYSYSKHAPKDDPFPIETVTD